MMISLREYIPFYRRNLKVALPVMLTHIGASLVGFVDTMMVGHFSTTALAAVSLSNAIFFTVMVFAMGLLMGLTPLISQQVGHKASAAADGTEDDRIAHLLRGSMVMTVLLAVATVIPLAMVIPFLGSLGQDPEVVEDARTYYLLITVSLIPFLFFCTEKQFLEGLGNTTVAMVISIAMNLLNVGLNYVLIYGHFGFPAMGATGAGIATLVSRTLLPVLFFAFIWGRKEWRWYLRDRSGLPLRPVLREVWKVGAPIGMQTWIETVTFTLTTVIVGWLGKEAVAAHQIATQIADLTFMLAVGVGSATTIRVSYQLGKGDLYAVRMASNASIHLVLLMNTIGALLMISLRNYIPMLFTEDAEVIAIASTLILCAGFFQYADGMQCVGAAMLRGLTDVKRPMVYAFIAYIVVSLPVGLLCTFTFRMGAVGMWIGFIVSLSMAAVLFHTRFRRLLDKQETSPSPIGQIGDKDW